MGNFRNIRVEINPDGSTNYSEETLVMTDTSDTPTFEFTPISPQDIPLSLSLYCTIDEDSHQMAISFYPSCNCPDCGE